MDWFNHKNYAIHTYLGYSKSPTVDARETAYRQCSHYTANIVSLVRICNRTIQSRTHHRHKNLLQLIERIIFWEPPTPTIPRNASNRHWRSKPHPRKLYSPCINLLRLSSRRQSRTPGKFKKSSLQLPQRSTMQNTQHGQRKPIVYIPGQQISEPSSPMIYLK